MKYRSGYKYQLAKTEIVDVGIDGFKVNHNFFNLDPSGVLIIKEGYAWDGASGAIDTKSIMRGALVHDCLYQMIRERLLPVEFRSWADKVLKDICLQDGMSSIRAEWVYQAVRRFGSPAAKPENTKPILEAP